MLDVKPFVPSICARSPRISDDILVGVLLPQVLDLLMSADLCFGFFSGSRNKVAVCRW